MLQDKQSNSKDVLTTDLKNYFYSFSYSFNQSANNGEFKLSSSGNVTSSFILQIKLLRNSSLIRIEELPYHGYIFVTFRFFEPDPDRV
ncbi:MAG: hypothetical protein ACQZ3N_03045 [cyanobacterium endosymbiont of Rhopalodia yunnanensis]